MLLQNTLILRKIARFAGFFIAAFCSISGGSAGIPVCVCKHCACVPTMLTRMCSAGWFCVAQTSACPRSPTGKSLSCVRNIWLVLFIFCSFASQTVAAIRSLVAYHVYKQDRFILCLLSELIYIRSSIFFLQLLKFCSVKPLDPVLQNFKMFM